MKTRLLFFAASLFLFLAWQETALAACSCVERGLKEAARDSAVVFRGVAKREKLTDKSSAYGSSYKAIVFRVTHRWKGEASQEMQILTSLDKTRCSYPFVIGKEYLVFADLSRDTRELAATECSRTRLWDPDNPDLKMMGKGKAV